MLRCYLKFHQAFVAKQRHRFLHIGGLAKSLALVFRRPTRPSKMSVCQRGFTLLELLLVISLIGIVGLAATTLIIDTGEIKRQDATEKRWDAIRKAIIGEPNLSLNSSPYISGYVADMGRLPSNIQELFIQGTQPDWTEIDLYVADTGFSSAFGGGWRGPYLYTGGSRFFRDGWSNEDVDGRDDGGPVASDDDINFGWSVTPIGVFPAPAHDELIIQSLGDNNKAGGTEFFEDFPTDAMLNIVNLNEWTLNSGPVSFNINFSKATAAIADDLELRIYRYIDNGDAVADFAIDIDKTSADNHFSLIIGDKATPTQDVPLIDLPIGRYAAVIWCTAPTTTTDVVYDGDCDSSNSHNPYFFTLAPGVSQVTILWNLP